MSVAEVPKIAANSTKSWSSARIQGVACGSSAFGNVHRAWVQKEDVTVDTRRPTIHCTDMTMPLLVQE